MAKDGDCKPFENKNDNLNHFEKDTEIFTQVDEGNQKTKIPPKISFKRKHISINLKRATLAKTAGRCSYPGCNRPAEIIHHKARYANSRSHESIIPLCKIHHEFSHNGLIFNENGSRENWEIGLTTGVFEEVDLQYRKHIKS